MTTMFNDKPGLFNVWSEGDGGAGWVSILPAFADVRTSPTPKDSDQALARAVFLSFSFPRLALC